jgi:hypothetical protein
MQASPLSMAGSETILFRSGEALADRFWFTDGRESRGLVSAPLPEFPESGRHSFYVRRPGGEWILAGEMAKPGGEAAYPRQYRATLDEEGVLRVHAGEVPYWTSNDPDSLKQEGCVYRAELGLQPRDADEARNPFSGIH